MKPNPRENDRETCGTPLVEQEPSPTAPGLRPWPARPASRNPFVRFVAWVKRLFGAST